MKGARRMFMWVKEKFYIYRKTNNKSLKFNIFLMEIPTMIMYDTVNTDSPPLYIANILITYKLTPML